MEEYIKLFQTHSQYETYKNSADYITPNVSYCEQQNEIHYNPIPPFFCKLTLQNGSIVNIEGSGELTKAMISDVYKQTLVSAEIGTLCTSIGNAAFYECSNLTNVVINSDITSINDNTFLYCGKLTNINIPDTVTSIGNYAFMSCRSLTGITIPDAVTSIGDYAFSTCQSLTDITIPDAITSIGEYSFGGCYSLTSITIPNNVTSIDYGAFGSCIGLTSVIIGNSVTSIDEKAFDGCSKLASIISLPTTAPTIQNNTFQSVKTNGTLTVPSGSTGYNVWMGTSNYYLGKYNWTKVEQ